MEKNFQKKRLCWQTKQPVGILKLLLPSGEAHPLNENFRPFLQRRGMPFLPAKLNLPAGYLLMKTFVLISTFHLAMFYWSE